MSTKKPRTARAPGARGTKKMKPTLWSTYHHVTRSAPFNIILVIGLLAVYEVGILFSGVSWRNAADVYLKSVFENLGPAGPQVFHSTLLVIFLAAVLWTARQGVGFLPLLPLFLAECSIYAAGLAPAILWVRDPLLALPAAADVWLDIGAGVYEEILFRWILIRGPLLLLHLDPWNPGTAPEIRTRRRDILHFVLPVGLVVVSSALVFAGYHHWGAEAEPFEPAVFLFRAVAGLFLAGLFLARGLAAAVYTHALYDILVHLAAP